MLQTDCSELGAGDPLRLGLWLLTKVPLGGLARLPLAVEVEPVGFLTEFVVVPDVVPLGEAMPPWFDFVLVELDGMVPLTAFFSPESCLIQRPPTIKIITIKIIAPVRPLRSIFDLLRFIFLLFSFNFCLAVNNCTKKVPVPSNSAQGDKMLSNRERKFETNRSNNLS